MTTLIKLGGSLVTDKLQPKSFRRATVEEITRQLIILRATQPERRIVVGHGSGSFGHVEARKYDTIHGVRSSEDRMGFARVGAAASELSQLILEEFLTADLPALRFQPSAMQIARNQALIQIATRPLLLALEQHFIPVVHGDVTLDEKLGGTIISTEALFAGLVAPLGVESIVLLGDVDGVLDQAGHVIPRITRANFERFASSLGASAGVDVTGGMLQKVTEMLKLVREHSNVNIFIANGNRRDILHDLLVEGLEVGSRISAS